MTSKRRPPQRLTRTAPAGGHSAPPGAGPGGGLQQNCRLAPRGGVRAEARKRP